MLYFIARGFIIFYIEQVQKGAWGLHIHVGKLLTSSSFCIANYVAS